VTAREHLRSLLDAEEEHDAAVNADAANWDRFCAAEKIRDAARLAARAYLASPPTVDPAVKRWQEVPPEVRRWVYNTMLPHTPSDRWDAGLTAAVALLAAVAGDEEQSG
jgi:hypothetical protein